MTETNGVSPATKQVLSPDELATYLGIGRTNAYSLLAKGPEDGGIRSFKLGRLRKVWRADADEFIQRQLQTTE